MRGLVGGHYEGQRTRGIRRLDSSSGSAKSVHTPTGDVTIVSGKIDTKMAHDILAARREIMLHKIAEAEEKLTVAQKHLDTQLRNARHLQILAPIQVKTREQVLLAAGRMSAQLKWGRMEIWRLKCHRDILLLDLNEERGIDGAPLRSEVLSDIASPGRSTITRLNSRSSAIPQSSPGSPPTAASTRPSTSAYASPQLERDLGMDDIFQSPALSSPSSFHRQQASWELPPLNFNSQIEQRGTRKPSISSVVHSSPKLAPATPRLGNQSDTASEMQRPPSSNHLDAAEHAVLEEAGLLEAERARQAAAHPELDEGKEKGSEKDKLERGKIRRSLHRTLRDSHGPTHSRSRKGKDTSPSIGASDEVASEDVLSRGTGSFVVHGKKASVITFGSELQNFSPEDRLRRRKHRHTDEVKSLSQPSVDDDSHSAVSEPGNFRDRHDSATTESTATGLSILDLDRRVLSQNLSVPVFGASDGEDSEAAVSFSEGRHTPLLSPVADADEDDLDEDESRLDAAPEQAAMYTPEESTSPVNATFDETISGSGSGSGSGTADRDETQEAEYDSLSSRMANSPPQTAVGA
jgi:hypothetical protein